MIRVADQGRTATREERAVQLTSRSTRVVVFVGLCVAMTFSAGDATAASVSECRSETGAGPERSNDRRIRKVVVRQPQYLLTFTPETRVEPPASYEKGSVVFHGSVEIVESRQALVPSKSLRLKSWWPFSPTFAFEPGKPIVIEQQALLRDASTFDVVTGTSHSIFDRLVGAEFAYLLVDASGRVCDRLFIRHPSGEYVYLPGAVRGDADDVQLDHRSHDEDFGRWGLRIIFNGRVGGVLRFQEEVWGLQGNFAKSVERTFDATSSTVEISGLKIEVSDISDGSARLKYNIPERQEIQREMVYRLRTFVAGGATVSP